MEYAVVELKGNLIYFLRSIKVLLVPSVYCSCFIFILPLDEEGKIISNISTCEDDVEVVAEVKYMDLQLYKSNIGTHQLRGNSCRHMASLL